MRALDLATLRQDVGQTHRCGQDFRRTKVVSGHGERTRKNLLGTFGLPLQEQRVSVVDERVEVRRSSVRRRVVTIVPIRHVEELVRQIELVERHHRPGEGLRDARADRSGIGELAQERAGLANRRLAQGRARPEASRACFSEKVSEVGGDALRGSPRFVGPDESILGGGSRLIRFDEGVFGLGASFVGFDQGLLGGSPPVLRDPEPEGQRRDTAEDGGEHDGDRGARGLVSTGELAEGVGRGVLARFERKAPEEALDLVGQVVDGRVAVLAILLERFQDDAIELGRHFDLRHRARFGGRPFLDEGLDGVEGNVLERASADGDVAREDLVEDDAECIHVRARVDVGIAEASLFGAHVLERSDELGVERMSTREGRIGTECLGHSEVDDLGDRLTVLRGDEDVRRLQIAVQDPARVCMLDSATDLDEEPEPRVEVEAMPVAVGRDGRAVHELHREPRRAVGIGARIEHGGDVSVLESREGLALGFESAEHGAGVDSRADHLERDLSADRVFLRGPEHTSHPSLAEHSLDLVGTESLGNGRNFEGPARLDEWLEEVASRIIVGGEQLLQFGPDRGVVAELGVEDRATLFGAERLQASEEILDTRIGRGLGHRVVRSFPWSRTRDLGRPRQGRPNPSHSNVRPASDGVSHERGHLNPGDSRPWNGRIHRARPVFSVSDSMRVVSGATPLCRTPGRTRNGARS